MVEVGCQEANRTKASPLDFGHQQAAGLALLDHWKFFIAVFENGQLRQDGISVLAP